MSLIAIVEPQFSDKLVWAECVSNIGKWCFVKSKCRRTLNEIVATAWHETQAEKEHRLSIQTRLKIYDALRCQNTLTLWEQILAHQTHFTTLSENHYRYVQIGIETVMPFWPRWHQDIDRIVTTSADMVPIRLFPDEMLSVTQQIIKGTAISDVKFQSDYWTDISNWHYVIGNLQSDLSPSTHMFVYAVYLVYLAAIGWLPFHFSQSDVNGVRYDNDIKSPLSEIRDFAYYSLLANTLSDVVQPMNLHQAISSVDNFPQRQMVFWQHWLFEIVPKAL